MRAGGRLSSRSLLTRLMNSTGSREARKTTLTALHTNTRDGRGTDLDRSVNRQVVVPSTLDALNNNNLHTLSPLGGGSEPLEKSRESSSRVVSDDTPRLKVVNSPERGPVELLENSERSTIVYTDASVKNGLGGIGVFFGDNNRHNISKRLHGSHESSGFCEIIAAQAALQSCAERNIKGPIVLRTDCLQIVEAMQKPSMLTLSQHSSEMMKLHEMAMNYPGGVQFEHVYAHMGNYGNERADQLATSATNRDRRPSPSRSRSKPPSQRMSRRTRKAFISRHTKSSPAQTPRDTTKHAYRKSIRAARLSAQMPQRSLVSDVTQRSRSTRSILKSQSSSVAPVSVPSVVTARERRQATVLRSDATQRSADSKRSVTSMSIRKNEKAEVAVKTDKKQSPEIKTGKETSPAMFTSRFASSGIKSTPKTLNKTPSKTTLTRPIIYKPKKLVYSPTGSPFEDGTAKDKRKLAAVKRYYQTEAEATEIKNVIDRMKEDQELIDAVEKRMEAKRLAGDKPSAKRRSNKSRQRVKKSQKSQKSQSKQLGQPLVPKGVAGQVIKAKPLDLSRRRKKDAPSNKSNKVFRRGSSNKSNQSLNRHPGGRTRHSQGRGGQAAGRGGLAAGGRGSEASGRGSQAPGRGGGRR